MTTLLSTRVSARFGASTTRATRAATRDRVGTMSDRHARERALATRSTRVSLDARARRSRSFRSRVSLDARASDEEDETRGGSTGASATRLGADDDDDATPVSAGPREDLEFAFGADYSGDALSTQSEAVVKGVAAVEDKPSGMALDVDYLQELIAIQEDCPKDIGFFGTRNMGFMHQQLIEILAYALCLTGNHIYTSGATGTNAAVIRGALRAERPELLTVVLPQSLAKQPRESRELLEGVAQIVEAPENEDMPLVEASRICNDTIVSKVKQIIVFAFHDSRLLLETCRNAKTMRKLVTLFYLD